MSIEADLLSPYHLIHPEKTTFRIKAPSSRSARGSVRSNPPFQAPGYKLYQKAWARTNQKIMKIVDDLQKGLLDDLVTFIKTTRFDFRTSIRKPIPTAVLLGTSKILNASLASRVSGIKDPFGGSECLPIQLNSRSCLTLSSTIKSIVNLLESRLEFLADSDSLYTKTSGANDPLAKDDVQNIRILYQAHRDYCFKTSSSSDSESTIWPKLVFIIDEFESFDSGVLEDLISIFSNLMTTIPIMMILSLNTSAEAIHSLLPRTTIFRLKMTPFAVDMGGGAVTSLIQKIAFDPDSVFDLSSGVVRSLMDGYERLNKSFDNLISKLQFIHLAHFHTNPLCEFLDGISTEEEEEEKEQDDIQQPPNFQYLAFHLRLTTSWKRARRGQTLLVNDQELIHILWKSYRRRKQARAACLMALEALERIGRLWPEKERTPEWILYNVYRPELFDYSIEMCKLIKHSNDEMLMNVLNSLSDMATEFDWLEPSLIRLSELMNDRELRKAGARTHLVNTHEPMLAGVTLLSADREFTKMISDVTDSLIQFFRSNLGPDSLLELHEAWTFDDKILLNEVFHPRYIHQLKSGLELKRQSLNPTSPLKEKGKSHKNSEEDDQEKDMNRLRRMYELYMETNGKIINLNDWFGAFYQQANPSSSSSCSTMDSPSKKQNGPNKKRKTQSMETNQEVEFEKVFLKSIGDLGFLGIISQCSRKKEHVTKHFFG
ncbi:Origin recognition complex subunit 3 [Puccinia graminis f. sp. tritici]|nr:Origin recognition complex subunit 3 [Puccinia graminis f. sp. tritici]